MEREAVERVARAMFAADWPNDKWDRFKPTDAAPERYRMLARAGIAEVMAILSEPTEAMIAKAGSWLEPHEAEEVWQLMISASPLSQGGQE